MDVYPNCKLCSEKDVAPSHFWKEHHIKESDYCLNNEPRFSKLTGDKIVFKNRSQYFESDFNGKNELKKWVKENKEIALEYCMSILTDRLTKGKINTSPSQVESRTLCMPSVLWYAEKCDWNKECLKIGLKTKFDYKSIPQFYSYQNLDIKIDTREQKPLKFSKSHIGTLKYGDYSCEYNNKIFIERKSLSDFISTLSSGYERFQREIERCEKDKNYLFVLVEQDLTSALSFEYLPQISRKIKASSEFIFHRVRDLMQKYFNIQFVFLNNRNEMVKFVESLYSCANNPENFDWQYMLDSKKFKIQ